MKKPIAIVYTHAGHDEIRAAFKRNPGIWAVHGVKTAEDWNVLEGLRK